MNFGELDIENIDGFYKYLEKELNEKIKNMEKELASLEASFGDDGEEDEKKDLKNEIEAKKDELEKTKEDNSRLLSELNEIKKELEELVNELEGYKESYNELEQQKDEFYDADGNPKDDIGAKFKLSQFLSFESSIKEKEESIFELKNKFFKKHYEQFIDYKYAEEIEEINSQIQEYENDKNSEEYKYYSSRLSEVSHLKENAKNYYSIKYDERYKEDVKEDTLSEIEGFQRVLEEKYEKNEVKFKKAQDLKNDGKNSNAPEDIKKIRINKIHSKKLYSIYDKLIEDYNSQKDDIEQKKEDIEEELKNKGIDISEVLDDSIDLSSEDYYIVELIENYKSLNQELEQLDELYTQTEQIGKNIETVETLEIDIAKIQQKLDEIDEKIDELQDKLNSDTLTDVEKNKAKREISKLRREKTPLISDIKEKKDEEKEVYEELKKGLYSNQKKISSKEKNNKNTSKGTRNINNDTGYYYYVPPTPTPVGVPEEPKKDAPKEEKVKADKTKEEPKEEEVKGEEPIKEEVKTDEIKEEEPKEKGMIATGSAVIDSFLNSNIDEESYIYENEFKPLSEAFSNATLKNNLKKQQKDIIRKKIEGREAKLSEDLVDMNNTSLFNDIIKEIYGEDASELSKYLSLDASGNLGFSNEVFDSLYKFYKRGDSTFYAKMNDIENMDDRTLNLLNNMISKYQEKIKDGTIKKGDDLDKEFSKAILEPAKLQIMSFYAKELEKPFVFRKLSGIFNSKKKSKFEKFRDLIEKTSDITKEGKVEGKLDLSDSVSSQDELLHSDLEKAKGIPEEEIKKDSEELIK